VHLPIDIKSRIEVRLKSLRKPNYLKIKYSLVILSCAKLLRAGLKRNIYKISLDVQSMMANKLKNVGG